MQQIVEFILAADRLKGVTRKTRPLGLDRYENSAEHSWQIALLATALAPSAETPVDLPRVIGMLLVHDLGEIETGDTIFYAEAGREERELAERAAVGRLFALLPPAAEAHFLGLWEEFAAAATPEALFAHAVDRVMPVLLNLANHGQSWRENGIRFEQVLLKAGPPIQAGSPRLWAYVKARLEEARESEIFSG